MKTCPTCKQSLAPNARFCPHCGHRFTHVFVKGLAWFFGIWVGIAVIGAAIDGNGRGPATQGAAGSSTATPGCKESDIEISKLRAAPEYDYMRVTGMLTNHCSSAVGPQLKLTVYGKAGEILKVDDFWPASTSNIPPNSEFPFEWIDIDRADGFSRYTISVIRLDTW